MTEFEIAGLSNNPSSFDPALFLSFLILSVTRLLTWDTPDSPIPKWVSISFSFSPVYL
jgi:hypothetical protein